MSTAFDIVTQVRLAALRMAEEMRAGAMTAADVIRDDHGRYLGSLARGGVSRQFEAERQLHNHALTSAAKYDAKHGQGAHAAKAVDLRLAAEYHAGLNALNDRGKAVAQAQASLPALESHIAELEKTVASSKGAARTAASRALKQAIAARHVTQAGIARAHQQKQALDAWGAKVRKAIPARAQG